MKTGRNDPCPCGSGKKYKRCCLGKGAGSSLLYRLILVLGGVVLLVGVLLIISAVRDGLS